MIFDNFISFIFFKKLISIFKFCVIHRKYSIRINRNYAKKFQVTHKVSRLSGTPNCTLQLL